MSTPLRVLIVERTDEAAAPVLEELRRGGYEPMARRVGDAAGMRAALAEGEWEIVLAGCDLARFSARAALMLLQNSGLEVPFIAVVDRGDESQGVAIMRAGGHDYVRRDRMMRLVPAVDRELARAAQRAAHRRAEEALRRREQYLKCLTEISAELLVASDLDATLPRVLERLRQTSGADRCYLFENGLAPDGELLAVQRYENWAEDVEPRGSYPDGGRLHWREEGFSRWGEIMPAGGAICGAVRDFPPAERERLESFAITWLVALPLRVDGQWYGFIGFDACHSPRQWNDQEIGLLRAAAVTISVAIGRLRAEERLRESEVRYRALAENTDDLICEVSNDGRMLYLSPNVGDVLGYRSEEVEGRHFADFVHPDDRNEVLRQFARADGAASSGRITFRSRHRTTGWRWFESTGRSFQAAGGERRTVAVCRDVTERKWTEERIARLNRIVRAIRDIDRLITRETDRARLLERACDILLGVGDYRRVWIDLVSGGEPVNPFTLHLDVGSGARLTIGLRSGGQRLGVLHVGAKPGATFDDEEVELLVEVADDLGFALAVMAADAERQRAGALLAAQNRVLEMVAAGALLPDVLEALSCLIDEQAAGARCAILLLHEDGVRLQVGAAPGFSDEYACVIDGTRGGPAGVIFGAAALRGQPVRIDAVAAAAGAHRDFALAYGLRACWSTPIRSSAGRILGAVDIYFSDAPGADHPALALLEASTHLAGIAIERWRAEERLRRYHDHLESLVETRTTELAAINKELEAFCYSVSHDLRGPLRSIDGFSQLLLEDYGERLDDEGQRNLHRVRAATQRMAQLIDDLLELSRVTRTEMRWEAVDLTAVAREIAEGLQATQPQRVVRFVIADGLTASGDARLLRIVLENLLGNAFKFTMRHPQAQIEFGAEQRNGERVYFVRDDGAGFDMAYAEKLFGAFQRLHAAHEFEGLGIGLATVARVIQRHGGRVSATGAVEQGATFSFTLRSFDAAGIGDEATRGETSRSASVNAGAIEDHELRVET